MKSGRFGILSAGALIVGALALMVFRGSVVGEAVYPVERLAVFFTRPVRGHDEAKALALLRGDLERLRTENARLRRALDYRARRPEAWLAADVLASGGGASVARHSIRVGKGSLDGVKKGAVVVVPEGLVGRVTSVSLHSAEVALLSDPSVKVSCEIVAGTSVRAHGILSGGEHDRLLICHASPAEALRPQARVVTSGLGGVFPPGFDVGTFLRVTDGGRGVEGEVLPCVDFSMLEDVFIRSDQ